VFTPLTEPHVGSSPAAPRASARASPGVFASAEPTWSYRRDAARGECRGGRARAAVRARRRSWPLTSAGRRTASGMGRPRRRAPFGGLDVLWRARLSSSPTAARVHDRGGHRTIFFAPTSGTMLRSGVHARLARSCRGRVHRHMPQSPARSPASRLVAHGARRRRRFIRPPTSSLRPWASRSTRSLSPYTVFTEGARELGPSTGRQIESSVPQRMALQRFGHRPRGAFFAID